MNSKSWVSSATWAREVLIHRLATRLPRGESPVPFSRFVWCH
jgi:hypothetical protein